MSKEEINQENSAEDRVTRLYELGVNLVPTLEDKTQKVFDAIKKTVEAKGGTITASSNPEMIPLSYTIAKVVDTKRQKYDTAAFGWIKFTAISDVVVAIKEVLDADLSILRHVILKTTEAANADAKEVAAALNPASEEVVEEKPEDEAKEENTEEAEEESKEVTEEEVVEETKEEESADAVDEAIDELVSEEEK